MRYLNWDPDKNEWLRRKRGISFEEIIFYIEQGQLLDVLEHPNREKYPNQYMFIVRVGDYAYLVPFVEGPEGGFLKTIIPSRKATRNYLKGGG